MEARQAAQQAIEYITRNPIPGSNTTLSKSVLVNVGLHYWQYTYKGTDPSSEYVDQEADKNLQRQVYQTYSVEPERAIAIQHLLQIPDAMISMMGAARWVDQGLPIIRFGHKRLAALMATSISKDNLQYVKAPWKAFFIEMPPELIHLVSEGKEVPVKGILVHTLFHPTPRGDVPRGVAWNWIAVTDTTLTQWCVNNPVEGLVGLEDPGDYWESISLPQEDHDRKVQTLIGRLICATCLMMSSPENFKQRLEPPLPKKGHAKKGASDSPRFRVFTEAQKIDVDVRPAILSYLQGKPSARVPSARVLVKGHFRRQPYGPHSSLRKVIWVEPYWSVGDPSDPIKPRVFETE